MSEQLREAVWGQDILWVVEKKKLSSSKSAATSQKSRAKQTFSKVQITFFHDKIIAT